MRERKTNTILPLSQMKTRLISVHVRLTLNLFDVLIIQSEGNH